MVNIAATALVTEAATAAFGEAGVSAATGVMTVCFLVLAWILITGHQNINSDSLGYLIVIHFKPCIFQYINMLPVKLANS